MNFNVMYQKLCIKMNRTKIKSFYFVETLLNLLSINQDNICFHEQNKSEKKYINNKYCRFSERIELW